jgi:threonine synthase
LARDGGLYVPGRWPTVTPDDCAAAVGLPAIAVRLIAPFAVGDALNPQLPQVIRGAFDFPIALTPIDAEQRYSVLELFHGPTAAFKDFGARFLASSLAVLRSDGDPVLQIMVATSGDTGGAVAAAFYRRAGTAVTVLFPQGLVSPTQQQQLTCWGENVRSLAVRGTFDDCQRLVKQAFADAELSRRYELSSANSINLGRLLPQAAYYAWASLEHWRREHVLTNFIVPTGNLGNALACVWARQLGLPIGRVVLACNANRTVPDYFASGQWSPRSSVATLASAMDVGNPSNMERLRHLYGDASRADFISASSIDDATIQQRISADFAHYGRIWCPHTAVAAETYARLTAAERAAGPWVIVATAHPAKFAEIVTPLVGSALDIPQNLRDLYAKPSHFDVIAADLAALRAAL